MREIGQRAESEGTHLEIHENLENALAERTRQLHAAQQALAQAIQQKRIAESRATASEERFRRLVRSCPDWVWEMDREGIYTYSSAGVVDVLGYSSDEVRGAAFYQLMPAEEAERSKTAFLTYRSQGKRFAEAAQLFTHRDGSERIIETHAQPVFDECGRVTGYLGIHRDITERLTQEEEAANVEHLKALGLLAGGIAHDFNNLLAAIFGNIELARMDIPPESEVGQILADSAAAMEKAQRLTGQLLAFTRGVSPVLQPTSVSDLVHETCRFALRGTDVRCEHGVPEDLWTADIDPGQIWQVLINILTNAREAMPHGGTIWVMGENVHVPERFPLPLAAGRYVKLSFRDEGAGVGQHELPRVFDPYFTTKTSGSRKGTGIGLAVCRTIVEKHGGCITLESDLGRGTTVTFFLPARNPEVAPAAPPVEAESPTRGRGCHILLLEDEPDVRDAGRRMLHRLGHTVTAVSDGADAIKLYRQAREEGGRPFDLVLLDLTVRGGMGGRDTLKHLRLLDGDVVAVVTSGYAEDPVIEEYRYYGFTAALTKPFSMKTLEETICRCGSKRQPTG